jgi:hypothetical protein
MPQPRIFSLVVFASLLFLPCAGWATSRIAEGVSPGAVDRLASTSEYCPTFSWEIADNAIRYELVVYRVDTKDLQDSVFEFSPENEVLFTSISGRAASWTPETSECFVPGESYVWFIRAVTDTETGEGSEWSEARFFEVAAAPSAEELARAVEVIRRWEAAGGGGSLPLSAATDPVAATVPATAADSGTGSGTGTGSTGTKSVITGTAAIRGEQPDASDETYGVVGTSASPDGAGIGAANTAGGPDLVLDGVVPTEISEAGVFRSSSAIETFTFNNPDTGELDVQVEGWTFAQQFVGSGAQLTDVDADTLDGTEGADFATEVEAAALVATHAASADHDGRYYTQGELSTSGTLDAVHWNNLGSVPPGFADGIDNDTDYSFGPGLLVQNGQVRIDPAAFRVEDSTLDSSGWTGLFTSIAVGDDGLGLISYYDLANQDLKVAHCDNITCTSATTSKIDTIGSFGAHNSLSIGDDGLGLISYYDDTNQDLKVAHCDNITCTSATTSTLDSAGNVGRYTSIAIGDDGLGLISYYDDTNGDLKVAHCDNTACSNASISTIDSFGDVGLYTSIAVGDDGLGLISYYDSANQDLKVAHCDNTACTSATTTALDSSESVGRYTSITIGADGLGLISYYYTASGDLKVAWCANTNCSMALRSTLDSTGDVGLSTSIAIGDDGLGVISYHDSTNDHLKTAHCNDVYCTSASISTVDSSLSVGSHTSIAIGDDGLPLISYYDSANQDLKVVHLPYGY